MPENAEQEQAVNEARLAASRRRTALFLEQIKKLRGSDFPHKDSENALEQIDEHITALKDDLADTDGYSIKLIQGLCLRSLEEVESYLPVLGFILRSTNVRNAFEGYDPLKDVVVKAIDAEAQLVVSSEWDFVPFTYPMSLAVLPNHVLVGGPAHESSGALLMPISGHEIGHSAWKFNGLADAIGSKFTSAIENLLAKDEDLSGELKTHLGEDCAGFLRDEGIRRVEELFCDAFGLILFGEAYFYAFEYLIYPGGSERDSDYPSEEHRVRFLMDCAEKEGIELPEGIGEGWRLSPDNPVHDSDVEELLDKAAAAIESDIYAAATKLIDDSTIPRPNSELIAQVEANFRKAVPHPNATDLSNIVCAGWRIFRAQGESKIDPKISVEEPMLKSIEVSEYLHRTSEC
ncbi:hypothetical protein [Sphingomicrobium marinum]|uniref:hypothetical protein n=1 Tax=Sphingomicrobium marinum TaxID=1227950 RepID=UPI0022405490|nr:hypothetical protein [Sphingomicrobium marinum]